jgi:hypothetical protein
MGNVATVLSGIKETFPLVFLSAFDGSFTKPDISRGNLA